MTEKRTRGRPPFKPTTAHRKTVEQMRYCGEPIAVIARAVGIDEDTLKKHFAEELADGHAKRRREVIGLMFTSARNGNVSAQKRLEEMGAGLDKVREAPQEPAAQRVGKKEAAKADADAAVAAGGKFAPRLAVVGGTTVEAD